MGTAQMATFGRFLTDAVAGFGQFTLFCLATARWTITGVKRFGRWSLLMPQLYYVGTRSIAVVVLVGGFVGMVLAIEGYPQFHNLGMEDRLGAVIGISVVKQIGPVLAAVMLAGRVGGSISAEIGTMRVSEQLDALRAMGVDPIAYLVVPRVLACLIMTPVLTIFSDLTGVMGGFAISVYGFGVNSEAYWENATSFVTMFDVSTGLIKSVVFGLAIGLTACYKGFYCGAGAKGVGRATTDAFVTGFIAIIIANFVLAKFLNDLYYLIYGPVVVSPVSN